MRSVTPMEELRKWMREVEEPVPSPHSRPHAPSDNDTAGEAEEYIHYDQQSMLQKPSLRELHHIDDQLAIDLEGTASHSPRVSRDAPLQKFQVQEVRNKISQ